MPFLGLTPLHNPESRDNGNTWTQMLSQARSIYAMALLFSGPVLPKLISIVSLQNIPTQDRLEGMAAFREKRPPKFVGK